MSLEIPCGGCTGCRAAKAKTWALRCSLELKHHEHAAFTTLTYDNEHLPPTLTREHLQGFLKRIRDKFKRSTPTRRVRFFACGEYGETTQRPHYHAILFGASAKDAEIIQKAWPYGVAKTVDANVKTINYVAGYTAKKIGDNNRGKRQRVAEGYGQRKIDQETGEEYWTWQPPFIQMSLKPGIGARDRDEYVKSWKTCAVHNGKTQPVPRYLHEKWKQQATPMEKEKLENEKQALLQHIRRTKQQRAAAEQEAIAKAEISAARRGKI